VPPLLDARADAVARLEHHEVDAAFGEVGGGGEADRSCADDRDGQPLQAGGELPGRSEVEEGHP
jgi:hypothetical protein